MPTSRNVPGRARPSRGPAHKHPTSIPRAAGLLLLVISTGCSSLWGTSADQEGPRAILPTATPSLTQPSPTSQVNDEAARIVEDRVVVAAPIPLSLDRPATSHVAEPPDVQVGDIFFEFDSARLTEESQRALRDYADWLGTNEIAPVTIEGHCDERGTEAYNLALGERRANTVRAYLTALGLPAARLRVVSYGKARPFCTDPDETCHRLNRRAHLILNQHAVTAHHPQGGSDAQ